MIKQRKSYPVDQRFSTDEPRHTGVTQTVRRCAAGVGGEGQKDREKIEE
jgi:hypothetical protein